ncbi:transmembrane protein 98-like [Onthophagus taurus]|uniref:transmembrane protein 98-like n=1 Tax=Onthophagus taurus TaxID=166361 RepID=UPI000C207A0E|nr:transmembrane protein 98-like [Onthophagus taurus]
MSSEYTEMMAAIAIGVLTAIFISAFVILVVICRRQRVFYYKSTFCASQEDFAKPEVMLIEPDKSEVEIDTTELYPNLEQILTDEQWIDDATGLIPHCLSILKTCRSLTERLTGLAMSATQTSGSGLNQIIESARKISSRVDDMVRSMYPPLDPRLLEARAAALALAVSHLALIARYECEQKGKSLKWIDKALIEMDSHISVLRDSALPIFQDGSRLQSVSMTNSAIH